VTDGGRDKSPAFDACIDQFENFEDPSISILLTRAFVPFLAQGCISISINNGFWILDSAAKEQEGGVSLKKL
jgi:hypothetical protein